VTILTTVLILLCVLLNTTAQILLKVGAEKINHVSINFTNFMTTVWQIAISPTIMLGLTLYVLSVAFWIYVLAKTPVSIAYPIASLGYITSAIAAYYFLGENLNILRISGILVILFGVFLVARS
jgi:drug/metabolite transporter (DMT)-like permease